MTKLKNGRKAVLHGRIRELDFLKGIALLFMVWDHIVYDLSDFFGFDVSSLGFFKEGIGFISSVIFMTTCGISLTLGRHNIKHGAEVFSLGMALTLFTLIFDKITGEESLILFGILHFLGLAMIIGHFVKKLPLWAVALLAVCAFTVGAYFEKITVTVPFLFPIGLMTKDFYSSDYFPLLPNLGYVFIGIIFGRVLYKEKKSLVKFIPEKSVMCFLGRHTLFLYFAHQPVVFGVIYIVSKLMGR